MKHLIRLVAFTLLLCVVPVACLGALDYRINDLGILGGSPIAVNNCGQIIGSFTNAEGASSLFLWQNGVVIDLGAIGGADATVTDFNDFGQIIGFHRTDSGARGFIWENGALRDLGTLGGDTIALGMNNRGQVVGYSYVNIAGGPSVYHPFVWQDGEMVDLLGSESRLQGEAHAISENGLFVSGRRKLGGLGAPNDAYVWGDISIFGPLGAAYGVNNQGDVVGQAMFDFRTMTAVLWQDGVPVELGIFESPNSSSAQAISNAGLLAGVYRNTDDESHAFAWQDGFGVDLGTLGGTQSSAADVNESGLIVGSATDADGMRHVVSWTPVPEPASISTLICGMAALGIGLRKRKA